MDHIAALAAIDPDSIIDRIAAGEYLSHIARAAGIDPRRLHEVLCLHPNYRSALQTRHQIKLDLMEQALADAPDLARAREQFRAAAWRAERECKSVWGASTELTGKDGGPLTIEIVRFSEPVTVEGEAKKIK